MPSHLPLLLRRELDRLGPPSRSRRYPSHVRASAIAWTRAQRAAGATAEEVLIGSTRRVAVHAYGAPCDMRKSFDTLAAIAVQQMRQELLSGDVFLFVGKDRKRAKALFWDGTGLCVYAKRLDEGPLRRALAAWRWSDGTDDDERAGAVPRGQRAAEPVNESETVFF